jgi:hypothetical protein
MAVNMQFIKSNKKLVLFVLLFLIIFPISLYLYRGEPQNTAKKTIITPTLMESKQDVDPEKKLLDYIQNRRPLANPDKKAKDAILRNIDQSGIAFKSETISIEYVKSADVFQVEILSTATDTAKEEAVNWFMQKGISKEGLCYLPISFYLNYEVANTTSQEKTFNPLAQGC